MEEISRDIIENASNGDMEAFAKIFKAHASFVYNIAFKILGKQQEAEDVAQEAFLTVYRKLKGFEYRSSLKTWLYRMTVNVSINRLKKISRDQQKLINGHELYYSNIDADKNDIVRRAEKEHQKEIINQVLAALTPEQKVCLVLRDMDGLSYQEIAQTLNINVNTVRSRLKRAREKLLKEGGWFK